ncbi:MAG: YncE family protein [Candidatus Acidiferrales bacterium]
MRRLCLAFALAAGIVTVAAMGLAQQAPIAGPYKVLERAKVGGEGGFDYVFADAAGRRLYIPRRGPTGRITVFNLDTLKSVGEIPNVNGHGAVIDPKTNHGFLTSKPVVMFDSKTLKVIKTIDVQGDPDGILFDAYNERVYDFSHEAPNATVIDAKDGSVVGTIDLGGAPEQAVSDGKGHLYVDIENKASIAVVDVKTLAVTAHYDISSKGGTCAGLAMDAKNRVLFAACRDPKTMVILNADDGNIITSLPIGTATDGAVFNPKTMETFSSAADGTLTVVKEKSPTSFAVEQVLDTMPSAKTLSLDSKTNRILLIAAIFDPPPANAPPLSNGRVARGPMEEGSFSILSVGK